MTLRWENYVLSRDVEFKTFWEGYLKGGRRNTLYILGVGFDPRTNDGIKSIFAMAAEGARRVIGLRYFSDKEEEKLDQVNERVQNNIDSLQTYLTGKGIEITYRHIILQSPDEKNIASINATALFGLADIKDYTDVVVDISAMPRGIFIPIIHKLLNLCDANNSQKDAAIINLHVVVTENPRLDAKIQDKAVAEEATFIYGFSVPEQGLKDQKKVWIPLLGESQTEQFDTIRRSIDPVETCVVLPFPSKDLKRGDKILDEYKELLFNDPDFEPRNILYVDESNPFQVYRLLSQTISRYQESFKLLDGCKIIVSALSSKLLSVGAFLAVYESKNGQQNIGIKQVESKGHIIPAAAAAQMPEVLTENIPMHLWLAGDPYIA
jgi:hypothetical protein